MHIAHIYFIQQHIIDNHMTAYILHAHKWADKNTNYLKAIDIKINNINLIPFLQ